MYKYFIFFVLLSSASVFTAEETQVLPTNEEESFTYCINENLKNDTSDWITFPITFGFFDIESGVDNAEKVTVSLPSEPKFIQANGMQSPHITVTDQDGMSFNIARMEIPEDGFNLKQSVNFLAESISKSSSKKLIGWGWPEPNPNDSVYFMMWAEGDKMIRLTMVKSTHLVYFLETSICNEIYRNFDWESMETDTVSFDTIMRDSLKTNTFTRSFVIEQ